MKRRGPLHETIPQHAVTFPKPTPELRRVQDRTVEVLAAAVALQQKKKVPA